jgi:hypothetical protein
MSESVNLRLRGVLLERDDLEDGVERDFEGVERDLEGVDSDLERAL